MNLGFSPFVMDQTNEQDHDQHHHAFSFGLNQQIVSSSSSSVCHIFFSSTQDHTAFYHPQLYHPHHQLQDDYYGYHEESCYAVENKVQNGLKLSLWKKEDEVAMLAKDGDQVKWMKKNDHAVATASITATNVEVKTLKTMKQSSSLETVLSSSYNCNSPIRVCSDCHTTKTPLWRSGPKGPKSLCNACGIRQRKARRAMAAAGNGGGGVSSPPRATKVKEKMGKKPLKLGGSKTSNGKKIGFEDFLINLSNKIGFHRVFPQNEKEAAILLMALSCGLVHGRKRI